MSGSLFPPNAINQDASYDFVRLLTCDSVDPKIMLRCLQNKSLDELMKAYESIFRNENKTNRFFGPIIDDYLDGIDERMFLNEPFKLITELNYTIDVPIMIGITSNEGAFVDDMWLNYAKQGYRKFKGYIENTILPNLLKKSHFDGFNKRQIKDAINWHYFQQVPKTTSHLLNSLLKLISEISYELPFYKTIELLSADLQKYETIVVSDVNLSMLDNYNDNNQRAVENKSLYKNSKLLVDFGSVEPQKTNNNLFAYVFHHSNSMDMRGNINYFGGL